MKTFGTVKEVGFLSRGLRYASILVPEIRDCILLTMPIQGTISFCGDLKKKASELKVGDTVPLTFPDDLKDEPFFNEPYYRFGAEILDRLRSV
jgi:hypothetical protein